MGFLKLTMKLRSDAAPHLYTHTIKELVKNDKTLSPSFEKILKLMKKTKISHVQLSKVREVVYVPDDNMHFERGLEPQITAWIKTKWSEEEIKDKEKDKEKHLKNVLKFYEKIGYEFIKEEYVNEEYINKLKEITKSKKEKKGD